MFFWRQQQPQKYETLGQKGEQASKSAGKEEAEVKLAEAESKSAEKMANSPPKTDKSKPRRGGWAPNPCPYLGGSPEAGESSSSAEASSTAFKYRHPSTNFSVELTVTDGGAVECPGCRDPKKQLVRHAPEE